MSRGAQRASGGRRRLTLGDVGEDELIRRLTSALPSRPDVVLGAGDDCAVVRPPSSRERLLLKTDVVVEGVHFSSDSDASLVGRKALARVISDIAAMGGRPLHAMVTLVAPKSTPVSWAMTLYRGIARVAREWEVAIVGGETSAGPVRMVSMALTGVVAARGWPQRSGGRKGDSLLVTGKLGGSIHGHHFRFKPRVKEARWLVEHVPVHAMMDLSDGLAMDLPRMAKASGLGYQVSAAKLPCRRGCTPDAAWSDGEDFELLLAVSPGVVPRLMSDWRHAFPGTPLTEIGRLVERGTRTATGLEGRGWDHFSTEGGAV